MMSPLLPMLATAASPFDADDYLFEVKWDGVRTLAAVEKKRWRLWGRELADYDGRYPELEVLRRLPAGTIVDGELVAWQDHRPDLPALLRRHQLANPARIRNASRQSPVHYVLFDLLFLRGQSLLQETLRHRRCRMPSRSVRQSKQRAKSGGRLAAIADEDARCSDRWLRSRDPWDHYARSDPASPS
jgi:bifunctional non-homologous end joining protein LigD